MKSDSKLTGMYIFAALLGLVLAVFFGFQKKGYYIDEYYTYTLANGRQLGIAIENGNWQDTGSFMDQMVSDESENFHLSQVYEATSNNVHPPLYYYLIHLSSSFYTGRFSKWTGLIVNILLWIPSLFLAYGLATELSPENKVVAFAAFVCYAFSPAILSGLMLIRMYIPLHLFTMLYAYILIKDMKRDEISIKKFLIPVFVTGFCGFMTQYYFVIVMFFMTAFYILLMLKLPFDRANIKRLLIFGATALFSLIATYFYWPVSVYHIFKGYRGADSFNSLVSTTNTSSRVALFFGNLSDNVFGGLLIVPLVFFIIGFVLAIKNKEAVRNSVRARQMVVLAFSSICYFLVITKIGLKAAYASNRYVYPVYGIFIILTVVGMYEVLKKLIKGEKSRLYACAIATAFMLLAVLLAHARGQVLFLYPEERILDDFVAQHPDTELLVFQKDDGKYDVRIKDYLWRDRVYWALCDDPSTLEDDELKTKDELLVYVDGTSDVEGCLDSLTAVNPSLSDREHVFTTPGGDFEVWYLN